MSDLVVELEEGSINWGTPLQQWATKNLVGTRSRWSKQRRCKRNSTGKPRQMRCQTRAKLPYTNWATVCAVAEKALVFAHQRRNWGRCNNLRCRGNGHPPSLLAGLHWPGLGLAGVTLVVSAGVWRWRRSTEYGVDVPPWALDHQSQPRTHQPSWPSNHRSAPPTYTHLLGRLLVLCSLAP